MGIALRQSGTSEELLLKIRATGEAAEPELKGVATALVNRMLGIGRLQ